jgi:hypothetical protein
MKKLSLAAAVGILLAGSLAWTADAQTWRGAASIPSAAQNFTPIEKAACGGRGPHCRWGRHWVCGPRGLRCWCAPC